jgi:hypothetical protein
VAPDLTARDRQRLGDLRLLQAVAQEQDDLEPGRRQSGGSAQLRELGRRARGRTRRCRAARPDARQRARHRADEEGVEHERQGCHRVHRALGEEIGAGERRAGDMGGPGDGRHRERLAARPDDRRDGEQAQRDEPQRPVGADEQQPEKILP